MELNFRQVHLDFHTSEHIEGIGENFNKKQFQQALIKGHVNSITVFSKCIHGWSYHPTKVNKIHPHLKFDLLGAQLEACKEIGVNSPVYISAGWDERACSEHPEWVSRTAADRAFWDNDFMEPTFHYLCYNTGYLNLLIEEIAEVMERYHPNGIFLDMSCIHPCYCSKCRQDIINRGKDPRDMDAVMEQAEMVYAEYAGRTEEIIHKYNPKCRIFHNAGHISKGRRDLVNCNTHLELESLPTGGWGYAHFPMSAAYVMTLDKEYLGMTGKFHSSWGEFGGFKHPNALLYETSLSVAFGAKCSIGDQLHPSGKMDEGTYEIIGKAYGELEKKEEWCKRSKNCADIGILSQEAFDLEVADKSSRCWGDIGANKVMLEGHYLYQFIDMEENLKRFKMVVLPDTIRLNGKLRKKLSDYLAQGGKLLASGQSGLYQEKDKFALDFGVEYLRKNDKCPDYVIPVKSFVTGKTAHVMYEQGYLINNVDGTEMAYRENPFFNRDLLHYSSHQHAPNLEGVRTPGMVKKGNTVYISWEIFSDYGKIGELHQRELIVQAIEELLGDRKTVDVKLPDRGITTLTKQKEQKRYVHHNLFAHTTNRGVLMQDNISHNIEVIEDIIPLYNIPASVCVPEKIVRVYLAPQMKEIPFEQNDNAVSYIIPEICCHQMVVLDYE